MKQKTLSIAMIYSSVAILLNSITTWDLILGILSIIPCLGTILLAVSISSKNTKVQSGLYTAGIYANLGSSIVSLIYMFINGAASNRHYISDITNPFEQHIVNSNYDAITHNYNRNIVLFGSIIMIAWVLFLVYYFMKIKFAGIVAGVLIMAANFVPSSINTNLGIISKTSYLLFGIEIILLVLLRRSNHDNNINKS